MGLESGPPPRVSVDATPLGQLHSQTTNPVWEQGGGAQHALVTARLWGRSGSSKALKDTPLDGWGRMATHESVSVVRDGLSLGHMPQSWSQGVKS